MASNAVPVVNSLTDLASNPNIQPVIDKGWGVDIYLSVNIQYNILAKNNIF